MSTPSRHSDSPQKAAVYPISPLLALFLLFGLLVLAGCSGSEESPAVAGGTPEPPAGGVQAIVTRIVNQITFVTSTPDPTAIALLNRPLAVLDLSLKIGRASCREGL